VRASGGSLTYAIAGAAALRHHHPFSCVLHYDSRSERIELVHLAIINAPVFGGFLGLRIRGASVADQLLDLIAVEHLPIRRLILAALHPILGIRRPIRGIRTLQVPRVAVQSERVLELALDGELAGRIPASFEVVAEGLRVVTPRGFADGYGCTARGEADPLTPARPRRRRPRSRWAEWPRSRARRTPAGRSRRSRAPRARPRP
jgi:diacylglycerol kinase (ATP)